MAIRNIPSYLPDKVDFVDTDTTALVTKLINSFEKEFNCTLYPADPRRAFILWLASVIIQERVLINESAKQNLPRYAVNENLDSLSELFHDVPRLGQQFATVTLKFNISTTLEEDYIITDPLTVTPDGDINYTTEGHIIFKAGETSAIIGATCTTPGNIGNGFLPGQINKLISDEFLYFQSVENTTESAGGSDSETDDNYYNRMRESEEAYSTAGPTGSYIYHAKSVSPLISDVSAESPTPGYCEIRVLLQDGGIPTEEMLQRVLDHINGDIRRPLTDLVKVFLPITETFDIDLTYYIPKEQAQSTKEIQAAVDDAINKYISWQTSKMGRDINPSYFYACLMAAGIKRVEINAPVFKVVEPGHVALLNEKKITFGGLEDE